MSQPGKVLAELLAFAARQVPYYRDAAWAGRLRAGKSVSWADIPITPKAAVKDRTESFFADRVPPSEGKIIEKFTSGSTGVPLRVLKTERHFAINAHENQRLAEGWDRAKHKGVVHTSYAEQGHAPGSVTEWTTGDIHHWRVYSFASPLVADLLCKTNAPHFNSRPSVVLGALQEDRDFGFLRLISTISEIIPPELPVLIDRLPDCRHFDSFGTVETGILASACAQCGEYHAATGHAFFEVLDEHGNPVKAGEMGRVVVTSLFNLAMPLLRYDLEDYVRLSRGGRCPRPGLAFSKIIGRERNLFKMPEGGRVTPNIPPEDVLALGIRQYKLIQRSLTEVDLLYVPQSEDVTISGETAQRLIAENLSPGIKATVLRVAEMPLSKGGKFLMHESLI